MLKSTHRSAPAPPSLPDGWTEHKAPTGHTYYYHAATNQSTYTRPAPAPAPPLFFSDTTPNLAPLAGAPPDGRPDASWQYGSRNGDPQPGAAHHGGRPRGGRPPPNDRPRSKKAIPGCPPWILVYTKLRRRFVHNADTGESLWKFPQDVMMAVIDMDNKERAERDKVEKGEKDDKAGTEEPRAEQGAEKPAAQDAEAEPTANGKAYDSDEYEEVEVTDDEDEEAQKRPRLGDEAPAGPLEFNEDDIAYQLAAMGQPVDGDGAADDWGDGYEEEPLSVEDAQVLFADLLDDHHVNPFTPWESLIDEGKIVDDERYTCLPNMKSRKAAWEEWSRAKMHALREQKARQETADPRVAYMALLQKHATPKLYWPEFKRKLRKEAEMKDTKLLDRDREKWYREYINRLKLPESTLKADLTTLLRAQPVTVLNRSTSLAALPTALLVDLRYASVPPRVRDPLVEAYIAIQPPAPEEGNVDPNAAAETARRKEERARREEALAKREQRVREEKQRRRMVEHRGREMLKEGEEELERAMRVGRDGLKGHVQVDPE